MKNGFLCAVGSFLFDFFNGTPTQSSSPLCKHDSLLFGDGFLSQADE